MACLATARRVEFFRKITCSASRIWYKRLQTFKWNRCIEKMFSKQINEKTFFKDFQELLLYARRQEIRGISLNANDTVDRMTPITGLHNAIGIDYHFEKQWIYWTDVTKDSISRIHLNGSSRQDIIPSGRLDFLLIVPSLKLVLSVHLYTRWLVHLFPNTSFLCPLKTSENLTVFWCFQGVEKGCIGNKWVNVHFCKSKLHYSCLISLKTFVMILD